MKKINASINVFLVVFCAMMPFMSQAYSIHNDDKDIIYQYATLEDPNTVISIKPGRTANFEKDQSLYVVMGGGHSFVDASNANLKLYSRAGVMNAIYGSMDHKGRFETKVEYMNSDIYDARTVLLLHGSSVTATFVNYKGEETVAAVKFAEVGAFQQSR